MRESKYTADGLGPALWLGLEPFGYLLSYTAVPYVSKIVRLSSPKLSTAREIIPWLSTRVHTYRKLRALPSNIRQLINTRLVAATVSPACDANRKIVFRANEPHSPVNYAWSTGVSSN